MGMLCQMRRARACRTCRRMKIKCADTNPAFGPCKRRLEDDSDPADRRRLVTKNLEENIFRIEKLLCDLEDSRSSTLSDKSDSARVEQDDDMDPTPFIIKPSELAHMLEGTGGTEGPRTSRTRGPEEGPYPSDPKHEDTSAKPHAVTYLTRIFNRYRKIGTSGRSVWMSESNKVDRQMTKVRSGTNITINIDNANHSNSGNTTTYTTANSHNTSSVMDYSSGNMNYTNNGSGTLNNASGSASIQYGGDHTPNSCPSCWLRYSYSWWPCFYWDGWMSVFCGWVPYISSWL